MSDGDLEIKVVLKQTVLNGSNHPAFLQRVATVYIDGREYRVSAPPEAKGETLDWVPHFIVRQLVDFNSEVEIHDTFGVLALKAVKKELETRGHETKGDPSGKLQDRKFARLAIEEARKSVSENDGRPHPLVGAVIVKDGQVLATAHRGEAEGNHAEYIALEKKLADAAVAGATVYTTLEPCTTRNHPKIPCAERLIARKVVRVVKGMLDPDPRITGQGQRRLRSANIITDFFPHDLMAEVEDLNREFTRKVEPANRITDSPATPVERQAMGARRMATDIVDKWVSLGYEHKCGVAKTLDQQGFDLGWVSADKEVEKVEFEGWEYVLVDQPDGSRARLKIHDHPAAGGYLVLLKRHKPLPLVATT